MKYNNDGDYNKEMIFYWLRKFCEWEGIPYDTDLLYSNRFIEFIIFCSKDLSTNVKGAGKFIRTNKKIYDNLDYSVKSADYLFKTFCYILREIDRKERGITRKRRGY